MPAGEEEGELKVVAEFVDVFFHYTLKQQNKVDEDAAGKRRHDTGELLVKKSDHEKLADLRRTDGLLEQTLAHQVPSALPTMPWWPSG